MQGVGVVVQTMMMMIASNFSLATFLVSRLPLQCIPLQKHNILICTGINAYTSATCESRIRIKTPLSAF